MKNYETAITDFQDAVKVNSSLVKCWTSLIELLLITEKHTRAKKGKRNDTDKFITYDSEFKNRMRHIYEVYILKFSQILINMQYG